MWCQRYGLLNMALPDCSETCNKSCGDGFDVPLTNFAKIPNCICKEAMSLISLLLILCSWAWSSFGEISIRSLESLDIINKDVKPLNVTSAFLNPFLGKTHPILHLTRDK